MTAIGAASPRLQHALARIDEVHAEDPDRVVDPERCKQKIAAELLYARRMSDWLYRLCPHPPEELVIAVRAQHLRRWELPRSEYPDGREGYRTWRSELARRHAELAADILRDVGYPEAIVGRVGVLVRKQGLKRDPEVQILEDVACLTFLEYYFADFAAKHDPEKVTGIVRKTWSKMSALGRAAAYEIEFDPTCYDLISAAIEPDP